MMDFERIAASVPFDATAAKVVSRGTHYEPTVSMAGCLHWEAPPEMLPQRVAFARDLTAVMGAKFGRMTVVGLLAGTNPKGKASWVVRCACGHYETRKAKAVRNPLNVDDCCRNCRHLKWVKKEYARLGSRAVEAFDAG